MPKKYLKVLELKKLTKKQFEAIKFLIKSENDDSILANLSDKLIKEYLLVSIKSNFLKLYILKLRSRIIGYALISKKPRYLISEFKNLKLKFFCNLFFRLKFISLGNIFLSLTKLDELSFIKKKLTYNSMNLNLLAVHHSYQSKGFGFFFLKKIFQINKIKKGRKRISCETYSSKAINFYQKKLNFKKIGRKWRFFKSLTVLYS